MDPEYGSIQQNPDFCGKSGSPESPLPAIDYLTKMFGTGGAGMLGLIWNPVWGGWL